MHILFKLTATAALNKTAQEAVKKAVVQCVPVLAAFVLDKALNRKSL